MIILLCLYLSKNFNAGVFLVTEYLLYVVLLQLLYISEGTAGTSSTTVVSNVNKLIWALRNCDGHYITIF